jgi:polyisoprenoid-binding protein YceI
MLHPRSTDAINSPAARAAGQPQTEDHMRLTKRLALPALTFAALVLPACTQLLMAAAPPVTTDPAKVPAGTYKIEPYHTQVLFSVNHMGFSYFTGNFSGVSGAAVLSPKKPASMSVSVSVPVASVSTTSPKLIEELKEADWLDATKFPTMVFRSSSITTTGPGTADITGTLTLHGVTKPLTLHAKFVGAGVNILSKNETAGFQLTGTLKRSDFGVSKYVPLISDEVSLTINAAFEKS